MDTVSGKTNPRNWLVLGFVITVPSVIFWCLVAYGRIFHDYIYLDTILTCGGTFCVLILKGLFPLASLLIAYFCNKTIQRQAISQNVWHRETQMMRLNRNLINWNALLILVMIISYFNN
ncbi:MAG: hypothetical protein IPO83_10630 [Chitinophagaceae bacterium]|nr:hypothetical protein [Chitinophagaceae bacterium]